MAIENRGRKELSKRITYLFENELDRLREIEVQRIQLRLEAKRVSAEIGGKRALVRAHADKNDDVESKYLKACKELIAKRKKITDTIDSLTEEMQRSEHGRVDGEHERTDGMCFNCRAMQQQCSDYDQLLMVIELFVEQREKEASKTRNFVEKLQRHRRMCGGK